MEPNDSNEPSEPGEPGEPTKHQSLLDALHELLGSLSNRRALAELAVGNLPPCDGAAILRAQRIVVESTAAAEAVHEVMELLIGGAPPAPPEKELILETWSGPEVLRLPDEARIVLYRANARSESEKDDWTHTVVCVVDPQLVRRLRKRHQAFANDIPSSGPQGLDLKVTVEAICEERVADIESPDGSNTHLRRLILASGVEDEPVTPRNLVISVRKR